MRGRITAEEIVDGERKTLRSEIQKIDLGWSIALDYNSVVSWGDEVLSDRRLVFTLEVLDDEGV